MANAIAFTCLLYKLLIMNEILQDTLLQIIYLIVT